MSTTDTRAGVADSLRKAPIIGVVRTPTAEEALSLARRFVAGGLQLIEITFTVPEASQVIAQLVEERGPRGPHWIGAGTVTDATRAEQALDNGAEFVVSPNVSPQVARAASRRDSFLVLGALTATEIVAAHDLGADIVKVYPLPPVGGASYLATVRQPIDTIPMLAAGGFGVEEIPAYRMAGASAFGIGAQILEAATDDREAVQMALSLARGAR